ncbi:MAG: hypothetical protein ACJAZO_000270 [Myxococcota bacterium]|jgi:hypothetical protein
MGTATRVDISDYSNPFAKDIEGSNIVFRPLDDTAIDQFIGME